MKTIILIVIAALLPLTASSQIWITVTQPTKNLQHSPTQIKIAGNFVFVAGAINDNGEARGGFPAIVKLRARDGGQEWLAAIKENTSMSNDIFLDVDDAGNAFLVSRHLYAPSPNESISFGVIITKFNHGGKESWQRKFDFPGQIKDGEPTAVAVDNSGSVYVAGSSNSVFMDTSVIFIAKYDAAGTQAWVAGYTGPEVQRGEINTLTVDRQGNIYGAGWVKDFDSNDDFIAIKIGPNGKILWTRLFDKSGVDRATALTLDAHENVMVAGFTSSGINSDYRFIKYGPYGQRLFVSDSVQDIGGSGAEPSSITVRADTISMSGWKAYTAVHHYTVRFDSRGKFIDIESVNAATGAVMDNVIGCAIGKGALFATGIKRARRGYAKDIVTGAWKLGDE